MGCKNNIKLYYENIIVKEITKTIAEQINIGLKRLNIKIINH